MTRPCLTLVAALTLSLAACAAAQRPGGGAFPRYSDADSLRLEHRAGGFGGVEYRLLFHRDGRVDIRPDSVGSLFRPRDAKRDDFERLTTYATLALFHALPDTIATHPLFGRSCATDAPTVVVTIFHPRSEKTVVDYQGCPWAPAALRQLEAAMDTAAGLGQR